MRWFIRIIWAVNFLTCLISVVARVDVSDELIKGLLWAAVWLQTEIVWLYERLAKKAGL